MSGALSWDRDGRDWPNRAASRFVEAAGFRWHVQEMGSGPVILLLHGTGASTHSWRDLAPILAGGFRVIAPDLPGHGFTGRPRSRRLSLPAMAADTAALLKVLGVAPDLVVGHSAGAAILCRMVLDGRIGPRGIVSLNGALRGFRGMVGQIFSPLAKLLTWTPLAPLFFSRTMSNRRAVERLVEETGSRIDRRGLDLYGRLVANPGHVGAALEMMANWDLPGIERDLPKLNVPLLLLVGANDRSIPPAAAHALRARIPGSTVVERRGLGHLMHEERPEETAALVMDFARSLGLPSPP